MTDLSLNVQPGQISGSMSPLPGAAGGFNPGMLQDLLRWKIGMAEKLRRDDLNQQRQRLLMAENAQNVRQPIRKLDPQGEVSSAGLTRYLNQGGTGMVPIGMQDQGALADWLKFMGPDRVHEGLMQTGRLLAGAGAGSKSGPAHEAFVRNTTQYGNRALNNPDEGPGTSRETGGGIPEDGWYYLHENEDVTPAPKTVKDIVMGNFTPDPKAPPRRSYETGTRRGQMNAIDMLVGALSQGRGEFENPAAAGTYGELPPLGFGDEMGIPTPPTAPETPEGAYREGAANINNWSWQNVGNPDVAPPAALTSLHEAQARMGGGTRGGGGGSFSGVPWTETRGAGGERSFSMTGTPESPEEKAQREHQAEVDELGRMSEAAASHARFAEQLLRYASERPNSPAYEKLREMAGDRLKMAQEMERVRTVRQASLDQRAEVLGNQEALKVGRELEAKGRVGAAGVEAQGRVGAAQTEAQSRLMATLGELAKAYGGIQDADPEAQQQMLAQLIQQFMVMGGMAEALGGGGFPNQ